MIIEKLILNKNDKMFKIKSLLAIILFCAVATSCNNKVDDQKIRDDISKQLLENNSYAGVTSKVEDGVVTLNGVCEGENCADNIENMIKEIDGVTKVENNIRKNTITDMTMRTSVQSILTKYPGVQADVAGGEIILRGNIDRENLQSLMSDLATLQPTKIDNQLVVK